MADLIDLTDIPVIDNHCHAVEADQAADVPAWRQFFTESPDPSMRGCDVAQTAFYRRLIRAMGEHFGVSGEESVLEVRAAHTTEELVSSMFRDASISGVVIDTGYPAPDKAMPAQAFRSASQARRVSLLRLEVLFQQLVAERAAYDDLVSAVRDELADVRRSGFAGFKSVVGYRTGLSIERWRRDDARAAFTSAREEVARSGAVRLGYKPLLDTLLHLAFEAAAAQELPVQFHVGYGDSDVDLNRCDPLLLTRLLRAIEPTGVPVMLLHNYPFHRHAGYLAQVYSNVFVDVGLATHNLGRGSATLTAELLELAPFGKVLYSSDAFGLPELYFLGAQLFRCGLASFLRAGVDADAWTATDADRVTRMISAANARRVYQLDTRAPAVSALPLQ